MSIVGQQERLKKPRGPRRLEYLPEKYRSIVGIEHLTTVRQLKNLEEWLSAAVETRATFVKLGCSVAHGEMRVGNPPRSTWVAIVSGQPQIIHLVMDPRSAFKWMSCNARSWNLAEHYEPQPDAARYWIVVMERSDGYQLEPNGSGIISVTRRKLRQGPNEGKMELLVEGEAGWWEQEGLHEKLLHVRPAHNEIFAGEDDSVWVTATAIRSFLPYSFADWALMESNREVVADVDRFIEDRAVEKCWH